MSVTEYVYFKEGDIKPSDKPALLKFLFGKSATMTPRIAHDLRLQVKNKRDRVAADLLRDHYGVSEQEIEVLIAPPAPGGSRKELCRV